VPGSVLGRKAKPSTGSGAGKGKKAGLALLAGAAGLAIRKRRGAKTEEPIAAAPDPVVPAAAEPVAPPAPDPLGPSTPERPATP
jgi:MYXO-CTERM domain-containing protein